MTREEALDDFFCCTSGSDGDALIKEIYDSLDSEVCANCRHYTQFRECKLLPYTWVAKYSEEENQDYRETESTFGCNKFERK